MGLNEKDCHADCMIVTKGCQFCMHIYARKTDSLKCLLWKSAISHWSLLFLHLCIKQVKWQTSMISLSVKQMTQWLSFWLLNHLIHLRLSYWQLQDLQRISSHQHDKLHISGHSYSATSLLPVGCISRIFTHGCACMYRPTFAVRL